MRLWERNLPKHILDAMWAGDIDTLEEIGCKCCCYEHTGPSCPARAWYGCRGNSDSPYELAGAWEEFYATYHGMSYIEFYDWNNNV